MPVTIAPLAHADPQAVEALLDSAFGPDRRARTAYKIRTGTDAIMQLSFAAFEGEMLVGSLQSWPILVGKTPLTLVGPVAVAPEAQGRGIGRALMSALIAAAPDLAMAMIGDPGYYGRFFGFTAQATGGWSAPGPVERHRLLARGAQSLPKVGMLGPRL